MNEKDIKMYILPHWSIIALSIIYILGVASMVTACVLFFRKLWWVIIVIVLLCILAIVEIRKGFFKPILINSQRVKYKGYEYLWEDIRLTICQVGTNGFNIVIGTEYATDEKIIKSAYKKHFYTLLKMESLDIVLRFSKHRIKIVNGCGEEISQMICYRKIKKRIDDFNATIA